MRNPLRKRWAVVAIGPHGSRWIAVRTWTRSGATIARVDLENHDHERNLCLVDAGIGAVIGDITYLVGPADKIEGPHT